MLLLRNSSIGKKLLIINIASMSVAMFILVLSSACPKTPFSSLAYLFFNRLI